MADTSKHEFYNPKAGEVSAAEFDLPSIDSVRRLGSHGTRSAHGREAHRRTDVRQE